MEKTEDTAKHTTYNHVLRFTSLFGSVQGVKLLASVARNKLASYLLGTQGFGLLAVFSSIIDFVTSLCNCGIPINATQHSSELYADGTPGELQDFACLVRTWILWASAAAVILSILLSPLISYLFFQHDTSRALDIITLTPIIVAQMVAVCECSLLKGIRQLRAVATIECVVAFLTLLCTVPFYYYFGLGGIIVALIASSFVSAIVHLRFSTRLLPYRIRPFDRQVLRKGWPFVRRGLPYVAASIAASISMMAVPLIILSSGGLEDTGLFRAAYAMMVGYSGMAFVALEADYYPRLSSTHRHPEQMNRCVNQQLEVCILLIAPLQILLTMCLPLGVAVLYTSEFAPVVAMSAYAAFHTFFRALMLPVAYIPLAWGKSRTYLLVELFSYVSFCLFMWLGWRLGGLGGLGVALSGTAMFDMLLTHVVYGRLYGFRISGDTLRNALIQGLLLTICIAGCLLSPGWGRYVVGTPAVIASALYSIRMFRLRLK